MTPQVALPPAAQKRESTANRQLPAVTPVDFEPRFSEHPTDSEIFRARVFGEPLVPLGAAADPESDRALADAILAYTRVTQRDDLSPFEGFLQGSTVSRWRPSVLANLGVAYRRAGYYSRALGASQEAWDLAKDSEEPYGRITADMALGQLAALHSRLGHMEELESLLRSIDDRSLRGAVTEQIAGARQALFLMRQKPEYSFRCGPLAVGAVLGLRGGSGPEQKKVRAMLSTSQGTSLAQIDSLAGSVGLKMHAIFREGQAPIPVPSVVHWKAGHFAAVIKQANGRYLVQDPTFGQEIWLGERAFGDEGSGYFLAQSEGTKAGWRTVAPTEAAQVWGKGVPTGSDPDDSCPCDPHTCGSGGSCPGPGMAQYSFNKMLAGLRISDTPAGYSPPRGPAVNFGLAYIQRDAFMPAIPSFSNLGPKWAFDWLSWIEDDPVDTRQTLAVFLRGGGVERPGFDEASQSWGPFFKSHATIVRTSQSPIRYERRMGDGSVDIYAQPDSAYALNRRILLTESRDSQGNAVRFVYDNQLRLVAISDAIGQVSLLSYGLPADPLKITMFTDPFGRAASIEYDSGGRLIRITDVINLVSSFDYDAGDFIRGMTTPYGTSTFRQTEVGYSVVHPDPPNDTVFVTRRSIEATDPLGATERVEFWPMYPDATKLPSFPYSQWPPEFAANPYLRIGAGFSLYWDKRAMSLDPGNPLSAEMTIWIWDYTELTNRSMPFIVKKPLENPVWFAYPGQNPAPTRDIGTSSSPSSVSRLLDDGTFQIYRYEYNTIGKVTRATDPLTPVGRETVYEYDANNIDLLRVKQKNGAAYELLETRTYNSQHLPLTHTDAGGQTTTFTYNAQGQIATVTTPPRAGITENRTSTYAYDTNGYLQSITGPVAGSTRSYTYDGYGRVRTTTDSDGYITTFDYDALDRVTKVTYPDATFEETTYNRLDAEGRRDRLGRWTRTFYDALRRVTAVRDPLGRTTTYDWCTCGSLDKLIDANGNATRWERDVEGRMTREIRADGAAWDYTYENTTSRLKQRKDPKNQITNYEYFLDDSPKQVSYTNAAISTPQVSYTHDPTHNRLATMTDGTGTTTYTYNPVTATIALGATLLASVDGPLAGDTVSYTYDELGRLASRGLTGFVTGFSYDALGRLVTAATPIGGTPGNFTFTYDGTTSRPLTLSYPNLQATQYTYFPNSGDHRLQQIKHLAPGGATISKYDYTYSAVGTLSTWSQQVGANPAKVYTLGYDAADQLSTAKVSGPTPLPVPSRYAYAYDPAGNRAGEQLDDAAMGATHNNRSQLTSRQPGGALLFRGTLDGAATVTVQGKPAQVATDNTFVGQAQVPSGPSNVVIAATDPSGNTRTNTYQVTEAGSTTTYTYDANGNLTGDGTKTLEWDAEDRLTAVKQGATTLASFVYDGLSRRAQKTAGGVTTSYVYDGAGVIEERLSTGATLRYVRGPGIDQHWAMRDGSGVVTYFLADHLGSVVQTTNVSGAVTLSRAYDPYGNLLSGAAQPGYAYTGREWDPETNLYYYRARYYDPKIGRFISEDPSRLKGGDINLYAYVWSNPTKYVDPLGLAGKVLYPPGGPGTWPRTPPTSPFDPPGDICPIRQPPPPAPPWVMPAARGLAVAGLAVLNYWV